MNRIAVAQELVKVAKLLASGGYGDITIYLNVHEFIDTVDGKKMTPIQSYDATAILYDVGTGPAHKVFRKAVKEILRNNNYSKSLAAAGLKLK